MDALQLPARAAVTLGGEAEERLRLRQLTGREPTAGYMLRSTSSLLRGPIGESRSWSAEVLEPELRAVWNSDLPFSFNDGPMWAGRGANALLTVGARVGVRRGRVRFGAVLAPQLVHAQNLAFSLIPYQTTATPPRSPFANPLHPFPESIDAPLRFGLRRITRWEWGQSVAWVSTRGVRLTAGTENHWWGPGIRNGIILSSHASGFPHLSLGTDRPWVTSLGSVEARWLVGRLDESPFFDDDPDNQFRSLAAVAVSFTPAFDENLTFGLARSVFSTLPRGRRWPAAALTAFRLVGRPNAQPMDTLTEERSDQIFAAFGRWVVPSAGIETYLEWARFEEPRSLRDFFQFPQHSQGYTAGFQWLAERSGEASLGLQVEHTNLEPSATWRQRSVFGTYTSRAVHHGYTHRGQVLGASIGPAASSQWIALDRWASRWRLGVFGGRVRWEAAAQFTEVVPEPKRADVSLFWGVRSGLTLGDAWRVSAGLSNGIRINYLFQTFAPDIDGRAEGVDIANWNLSLTLSKVIWAERDD